MSVGQSLTRARLCACARPKSLLISHSTAPPFARQGTPKPPPTPPKTRSRPSLSGAWFVCQSASLCICSALDSPHSAFLPKAYDCDEAQLRRELEEYGPIKTVAMVATPEGKPRGYAFVEFENERDMHSAFGVIARVGGGEDLVLKTPAMPGN